MNPPWDIRPGSTSGDRDPKNLFAAIGEALTEWENVEFASAKLFAVFVSTRKNASFWSPAAAEFLAENELRSGLVFHDVVDDIHGDLGRSHDRPLGCNYSKRTNYDCSTQRNATKPFLLDR